MGCCQEQPGFLFVQDYNFLEPIFALLVFFERSIVLLLGISWLAQILFVLAFWFFSCFFVHVPAYVLVLVRRVEQNVVRGCWHRRWLHGTSRVRLVFHK